MENWWQCLQSSLEKNTYNLKIHADNNKSIWAAKFAISGSPLRLPWVESYDSSLSCKPYLSCKNSLWYHALYFVNPGWTLANQIESIIKRLIRKAVNNFFFFLTWLLRKLFVLKRRQWKKEENNSAVLEQEIHRTICLWLSLLL